MNKRRVLSLLWAAAVALLAVSLVISLKHGVVFETSLLALLPEAERDPVASHALDHMAAEGSQRLLFLIRSQNIEVAGKAADALAAELQGRPGIKSVLARLDKDPSEFVLNLFRPARYGLLTQPERELLTKASSRKLAQDAFSRMLSPLGPPRLVPIESDPLGLFSQWLLDTVSQSALRVSESRLIAQEGGQNWVLVLVDLTDDASTLSSEQALRPILAHAIEVAKRAGASEVLRSGFLFHAAEASASAQREISFIGMGSTLGVIFMMLLVFRTLRPMSLVLLTIAVGCLCALATTQFIFTKVHVLTLVFGASVIGVAVDYGLFYFSGLFDQSRPWEPHLRLSHILTALLLALFTTLLAYSLLAVLPFPALRQMGVFALSGLSAAWLCSVLWLPELSASLSVPAGSPSLRWLFVIDSQWPRFDRSRTLRWALGAMAVLSVAGLSRLKINDDVRQLYASSRDLIREQERAQSILHLPEAGQFLLLQAPDKEALLRLEESLVPDLDALKSAGSIVDWQGVSQFVPSLVRQNENRALVDDKIFKSAAALDELSQMTDAPELAEAARREWRKAPASEHLTIDQWLASDVSAPFRHLWLGYQGGSQASLVSLRGITDSVGLAALTRPGVSYIDHLSAISSLMRRFRNTITWLLLLGYVLAAAALYPIYRTRTWRALAPALIATLASFGLIGWMGQSLNLFSMIGQVLVLAMGVDYGIFMQAKRGQDFGSAILGVTLAAMSTLLSFGLLTFSSTPALSNFGLSVLVGIGFSWILAPCFVKESTT